MSSPPDMGAVAGRELATIASMVDGIDAADFTRSTQLPGWTVEDLVRHVTGVATRHGEAFHRARLAIEDEPAAATVTAPVDRLAHVLRIASSHLTDAVGDLDVIDAMVPLPYATLPATFASYVLLVEYGVHRYDLEVALNGSGRLAADVAGTIADLLGLTLPALASPGAAPSCRRIRFEPQGRRTTTLAWRDGTWTRIDDPAHPAGVVQGAADAVALFVMGRVTETGDQLAVEPDELMTEFKTMFPGP